MNYDAVDFFKNIFDKDASLGIDKKEWQRGFEKMGIKLPENEKEILWKNISGNQRFIDFASFKSFYDNYCKGEIKEDNISRISKGENMTQNGEIYNHKEKNMNLYKNELKMVKPKPIIKTFLSKDIKINHNYTLVENLQERQILPELYDDFEEEDIKSLEKSLERSVDKILH